MQETISGKYQHTPKEWDWQVSAPSRCKLSDVSSVPPAHLRRYGQGQW